MASLLQLSVTLLFIATALATPHHNANISGTEQLHPEGKFTLSWNINEEEKRIYFEISAETLGYVGFGFSPSGGSMAGADIFIAGVDPSGKVYSGDYHATDMDFPFLDVKQNYDLISATESGKYTHLKFSRLLNTCDEDDFPITDETMKLIWSMGHSDDLRYHKDRGAKSVNFYMTDEKFDSSPFSKLDLTVDRVMSSDHTMYWCTIHELPRLWDKQHIVAFEPILDNWDAEEHTHHYVFFRCIAPEGVDPEKLFGRWTYNQHPGDNCHSPTVPGFPHEQYCNGNQIFVWAKGGKRMIFPPDLGLPLLEKPGTKEYFAMEIHYDNPLRLPGKRFNTGGRIWYTDQLRPTEVGIMHIEARTEPQLVIPPRAQDFIVAGHCSPECTDKFLRDTDGLTVFNNLMHAHLAGRKVKLRQWRDGEEMPWLDNDNYYDFDFQQNKPLKNPRKILRGDQLTVECTYDSMKVPDGKAVIGGASSREEMCQAIMLYYPRVSTFNRCGSIQEMEKHMALLGITEWEKDSHKHVTVTAPRRMEGDYLDVISYRVNWTDQFRRKFQEEKRFGYQKPHCANGERDDDVQWRDIKYPDTKEYKPRNTCLKSAGNREKHSSLTFLISVLMLLKSCVHY